MRDRRISILLIVLALFCGCGGKGPQVPSQRKGEPSKEDSTQLAMMELTLRLAEAADEEVARAVRDLEEHYALYEAGSWIYIKDAGETSREPLRHGKAYALHLRVYTLDGDLLSDEEGTYTLGKLELPYAVDRNLEEMHPGAKIRMYVPWYTAYGQSGTEQVPPYENVIIDIEIEE